MRFTLFFSSHCLDCGFLCSLSLSFTTDTDVVEWAVHKFQFWWCQASVWVLLSKVSSYYISWDDTLTYLPIQLTSSRPTLPPQGDAWMSKLIFLVGCSPCMTDVKINVLDWLVHWFSHHCDKHTRPRPKFPIAVHICFYKITVVVLCLCSHSWACCEVFMFTKSSSEFAMQICSISK